MLAKNLNVKLNAIFCDFERWKTPKSAFSTAASNWRFVRIAVIGPAKMLRSIANVRFGEAAPQRRDRLQMSGKGRSCRSTQMADCRHSLQVRNRKGSAKKADAQGISPFFLLCKRGEWRQ